MVNKYNFNLLGEYLFKRICRDQEALQRERPRNNYGLFINSKDLQKYVWDYYNIGIDEDGLLEAEINKPFDNYWDESDGEPQ